MAFKILMNKVLKNIDENFQIISKFKIRYVNSLKQKFYMASGQVQITDGILVFKLWIVHMAHYLLSALIR